MLRGNFLAPMTSFFPSIKSSKKVLLRTNQIKPHYLQIPHSLSSLSGLSKSCHVQIAVRRNLEGKFIMILHKSCQLMKMTHSITNRNTLKAYVF